METTYDVRVYKTEVYRGTRVSSHKVRWKTGSRTWKRPFRNSAQAEVFRAELLTAARKGEAFNLANGEPVSWQRDEPGTSWYEFATAYVDMKWRTASAKYRRVIAQALAAATAAIISDSYDRPDDIALRRALVNWGYNSKQRASAPVDVADVLRWLVRNTRPVSDLADPALCRQVLAAATSRLDGKRAAATSVRRNRAVLFNALEYAVELNLMNGNPITSMKWRAPKAGGGIDRRVVINPAQAQRMLAAVESQRPSGPRLVAFFGVLYYSGLRPEEAIGLRCGDVILSNAPSDERAQRPTEPSESWGELHLRRTRPDAGGQWTDDGASRDRRGLKHRADGETRTVPCPPALTELLRRHLTEFGGQSAEPLFRGVQGGPLATITYRRVWEKARLGALSTEDYQSPLARRPYDLRHACLSTWLNGGVAPTQVAEWAGHSVEVLLRVYAKCLDGQQDIAKRRIQAALDTSK